MYDIKTPPDFKKKYDKESVYSFTYAIYLKSFREYCHNICSKLNEKPKK